MNPLINLPYNQCPIHIMITRPGAIAGMDGQRDEIAGSLPKPMPGKAWVYQPIAAQPLRFATAENADKFIQSINDKKPTDEYFVPPMVFNQRRQKWGINPAWGTALGELVVFTQVDAEPTIDGKKLETGPTIGFVDATGKENGIYEAKSGEWTKKKESEAE